ncbi:hypothetical protein [Candidatus Uabimicrobium amorphum]|uniref:Uncharacterized protein n=1 Tax=Uabimicrobium amorphum TaxID=2596890 RepID=A0A5S9F7I4_UABAM|nr:hypothetical protein [Candidatus Uabimicrobium amorphum]BBM87282.1 hypothetical protein UABAM_05685 [Candidatus Uabimicrobium amorphum]
MDVKKTTVVRHIRPKIEREKAQNILRRKRGIFCREQPQKLTLIHFPYYYFSFAIGGKAATLICDGVTGTITLVDFDLNDTMAQPEEQRIPFIIEEKQALSLTKEEFSRLSLRQNIPRFSNKAQSYQLQEKFKFTLPYWVYYFSKKGNYDCRVCDAIMGHQIGVRLKSAFVKGLIALRNYEKNSL